MRRLMCIIAALSAICAAQAAKGERMDGHWWKELSPLTKSAVAVGFIIGTDRASDKTLTWCMTHNGNIPRTMLPTAADQRECLQEAKPFDLGNVTSRQMADGLDQFYGDFLNEQIPIRWAIEYTCDELIGVKSVADLKAELLLLRRESEK